MGRQLELFAAPAPRIPELDFAAERELAARLPPHVRFGTSSWTFPGWAGIVYPPGTSERELLARGLELYARHPLLRTVGIDRSYYAPLDRETLARYAAELPPGFRAVMKVWNDVTSAVDPKTRQPNPRFLSVEHCMEHVLGPVRDAFLEHAGPLVFELPPLRRSELPEPRAFAARLSGFFAQLPGDLEYAVELRNRELLTHAHLEALAERGVGHVLNFWERMPDIGAQLDIPGVLTAPFVVARLLIPPGQRYDDRKRSLAPFDRVVDPQEKMRADVERLAEACEKLGKVLLVIVNNKAEGSSPLTVRALAERLARPRAP
ncbi:MAG: DUF72 domain-containing protein [Myxococcales bacterium]|nr:DUF72 domain-containing protein [Myxococcales bacterium]